MTQNLSIHGMARSGTTLVDKLLCCHNQCSILSQPFPLLFVNLKKAFYSHFGIEKSYYESLNNLFIENDYKPENLVDFLDGFILKKKRLESVFSEMIPYSGQYTKLDNIQEIVKTLRESDLAGVTNQLLKKMAHKKHPVVYGFKETMCEEFIPYFFNKNCKIILITRDPRDVAASFLNKKNHDYVGRYTPLLFIMRNWRKSIAFLLKYEDHPLFYTLKYEDLIMNFDEKLDEITDFIEIVGFDSNKFDNGIFDQNSKLWMGNSSHCKSSVISEKSIGSYDKILSEKEIKYIETICSPEMNYLGYKKSTEAFYKIINSFSDREKTVRKGLDPNYSCDKENVNNEIKRLEFLDTNALDTKTARKYFIFNIAYEKLKGFK